MRYQAINLATDQGIISGISFSPQVQPINHIGFANDNLIFTEARLAGINHGHQRKITKEVGILHKVSAFKYFSHDQQ